MAGRTDGLIKNFRASGAIGARRIVKFGAGDDVVQLAAGSLDAFFGVTGELAKVDGERTDVHMSDIAEVVYGGNVNRGDFITSDANGAAIAAAPAAGVNARVLGVAMVSGVAGDIGSVDIQVGRIQG